MTREEAIKELTELLPEEFLMEYTDAIKMGIKALEKDQCGDCIDRKTAMECFVIARRTTPFCDEQWKIAKGLIEQLPSVTTQSKMGRWLHGELIPNDITGHFHAECSVCGKVRIVDNFCPNCGTKMQEIKE